MTHNSTEKPVAHERADVILTNAERRNLRRKLKSSVQVTKDVLNPKTQVRRLVERQKKAMSVAAADAKVQVKQNAPLLAAVGLTAILLAARRPIAKWINRARQTHANTPDGN